MIHCVFLSPICWMMFIENFFDHPWWIHTEINLDVCKHSLFLSLLCYLSISHWSQPTTFNHSPSFSSSPSILAAFVSAVSGGASSLHPPVLPTECGGQRGADQIVWGVSWSGERSQALPHAAPRTARNADAQDQTETFCWYTHSHAQRHR